MANELVHKLLAWTVAISVAIVVVLLLRRPLRRLLGAGLAYVRGCWCPH
jgi:beta-lactamase regulating signal transducer with metallopeptidase domain